MKNIFFLFSFFFFLFSFSAQSNILNVLDNSGDSSFALEETFALKKELKINIRPLFSNSDHPHNFIQAFESGDFKKALAFWQKDMEKSSFSKSSTGIALYSYILFKNGFEVLSLKNLFEKAHPEKIDSIVKKLWKENLDKKYPVWDYFFVSLEPRWQSVFSPELVFKIASKKPVHLDKDEKYMKALFSLPVSDKTDTFLLEWSFVLHLIKQNDMDSAVKVLIWMMKNIKDPVRMNKIYLLIGRLLADTGEMESSIHYYNKVNKKSYALWLSAQEEKAWIFFNEKDYRKAYSSSVVFSYPGFKKEISPYMFFIMALSQLKNCDYPGVFRSLSDFKYVFSNKRTAIEQMKMSKSYDKAIKELSNYYKTQKSSQVLSPLSYNLKSDSFLRNHILLYNYIMEKNQKRKSAFPLLQKKENQIALQLKALVKKRLDVFFNKELEKINSVLNNFHIVEAEALYRIHGFHSRSSFPLLKTNHFRDVFSFYKSGKSNLFFPFDSNEIWLDELSDYQALVLENCPKGAYIL